MTAQEVLVSSDAEWQLAIRPSTLHYHFTVFLSAYLLFSVQLLLGKDLLPWFGGTPAVWTARILFFQVLLPSHDFLEFGRSPRRELETARRLRSGLAHRQYPGGECWRALLFSPPPAHCSKAGSGRHIARNHLTGYTGVIQIARDDRYFTYLKDGPARVDVIAGDARLSM